MIFSFHHIKSLLIALCLCIFPDLLFGQCPSGEYINGLKLACNSETKRITGYYEGYSGWDEQSKLRSFRVFFISKGN